VTISKADINCEVEANAAMLDLFDHIRAGTNHKWEFYQKSTTLVRYLLPKASTDDEKLKITKKTIKEHLESIENLQIYLHSGFPLEAEIDSISLTNGDYVADSYDVVETFSLSSSSSSSLSS